MNCPNCSTPNAQGAQFCGSCGFALVQNTAPAPAVTQIPVAGGGAPTSATASSPELNPAPPAAQAQPAVPAAVPQPMPQPQPAAQPYSMPQQPFPASPAAQAQPPAQQDYSIKLFKPKHILIIVAVTVGYAAFQNIFPALVLAVWIGSIIYTYITVTNIKKNPAIGTSEPEKQKAVALMTFDPLITQAIYYYRLRKVNDQLAQGFNMLGWKVLGLAIAIYLVAIIVLTMIIFNDPERNAVNTSNPPQASNSAPAPKTGYPERTKAGFIQGCVSESGNTEACTCLFNEIEKNITHEEFLKAEQQIKNTGAATPKYQAAQDAALKACGY